MIDQYNRKIEYMRISITDRCNLRCRYCMPAGIVLARHAQLLTYEELLQVCAAAVSLGIHKFKITGGEPLVRRGCLDFIRRLKRLPGVSQVTLTTNGVLLEQSLTALQAAGIDGINISLDTLDEEKYRALTGSAAGTVAAVQRSLRRGLAGGLKMKINAVLLAATRADLLSLAGLAAADPVDVRFIELMPIGEGTTLKGIAMEEALAVLKKAWPDLTATAERRGNGPAHYYKTAGLTGRIGFIDAISHEFCGGCNRVRLTAMGRLKPCLCYDTGLELKELLSRRPPAAELRAAMADCIYHKPKAHCFLQEQEISEHSNMHQIGG